MGYISLVRFGRMALLIALQLIIFNRLHLFGYATPLVFGYMLMRFRCNSYRMTLLLWGFFTGLIYDIFADTMGMASASMTLLGFVQPGLVKKFMPKDETDKFSPRLKNMDLGKYILYALSCMAVLHTAFYFLEAFSLSDFFVTFAAIIVSTLLSTLIVVLYELIAYERIKK